MAFRLEVSLCFLTKMIYLFYGTEPFLVYREYEEFIKNQEKENSQMIIKVFDFDQGYDFGVLQSAFFAGGGLFSKQQLIVIKNPLNLKVEIKKAFLSEFKQLAKKDFSQTKLLIVDFSGKKKDILLKDIKKIAKEERFLDKLTTRELANLISCLVKDYSHGQLLIDSKVVSILAVNFGNDLWRLSSEIQKLVGYKFSGQINQEDLKTITSGKFFVQIFDLMDAIGAGNKSLALTKKENLLDSGENEFYLFSMIVSQLRNMLIVKDSILKGITQEQILKLTKMHPFVFKKSCSQVNQIKKEKLEQVFKFAGQLDEAMKVGKISPRDALDEIIIKS